MSNDLAVVLPGILGSTLHHNGKPVWEPSSGAILNGILTFGNSIKRLELPGDLGDEHPGDGVEARALMPSLHSLPGIWSPIGGYSALLSRLRKLGYSETHGNLLPLPYDWRLSNRFNGERVKRIVEAQLRIWRESSPANRDARLVFVCHSMGGIVARWYVEHCGGAEYTRKVITIGTPYRGATKSLVQLMNGVGISLGPLQLKFAEFGRSLPSIHQLLPDFACIEENGSLYNLREKVPATLNSTMVADAMSFHDSLARAEDDRPESLDSTHIIVGFRQPTPTTITVSNGIAIASDTYLGEDHGGDGTVPEAGSLRRGLRADSNLLTLVPDAHGHLQSNRHVLDHVEGILSATAIRYRGDADGQLRVSVPEYALEGEPVQVTAGFENGNPQALTVTFHTEEGRLALSQQPRMADALFSVRAATLQPGGYRVTVAASAPGASVNPVTNYLIVWPKDQPRFG